MRIVITQTVIVIDIPEEAGEPVPNPANPPTLVEKLRKETETGRDSTLWPSPLEAVLYGTFLT